MIDRQTLGFPLNKFCLNVAVFYCFNAVLILGAIVLTGYIRVLAALSWTMRLPLAGAMVGREAGKRAATDRAAVADSTVVGGNAAANGVAAASVFMIEKFSVIKKQAVHFDVNGLFGNAGCGGRI